LEGTEKMTVDIAYFQIAELITYKLTNFVAQIPLQQLIRYSNSSVKVAPCHYRIHQLFVLTEALCNNFDCTP
jgi:hypothetical protein